MTVGRARASSAKSRDEGAAHEEVQCRRQCERDDSRASLTMETREEHRDGSGIRWSTIGVAMSEAISNSGLARIHHHAILCLAIASGHIQYPRWQPGAAPTLPFPGSGSLVRWSKHSLSSTWPPGSVAGILSSLLDWATATRTLLGLAVAGMGQRWCEPRGAQAVGRSDVSGASGTGSPAMLGRPATRATLQSELLCFIDRGGVIHADQTAWAQQANACRRTPSPCHPVGDCVGVLAND